MTSQWLSCEAPEVVALCQLDNTGKERVVG
jgi:hypothetical protein